MATDKEQALKDVMAKLQKKHGQDFITALNSVDDLKLEMIPTGSLTLDYLMGGGLVRGRIYEIYGEASSGKSLTTMFLMSTIQKAGGKVALIDAENAFNSDFAAKVGVDVKSLILSQEACLENVFEMVHMLAETRALDLIVVDSVASLVPRDEMEGTALEGKQKMADVARLLSRGLRNMVAPINKSGTIVIFINQVRDNLDPYAFGAEKKITPGGKALKFYSSVRLEVKKGEKFLDPDKVQIGNALKIKITKNKVGIPFLEGNIHLYYGTGVDLAADTLDMGLRFKVLTQKGAFYYMGESKLGQGEEKVKQMFRSDPAVTNTIRAAISQAISDKINSKKIDEVTQEEDEEPEE